jgi:FAD/FMN-containing dehydrogenase
MRGGMFDVLRDPDLLAGYLSDASNTHGSAEALVRPRCAEEVAEVLAHCQARGIPVTVTAQRTATTGAPVPNGGWLLSTERLDTVHSLDEVDAGVILGAYQAQCEAAGRHFPPDPTSRFECSLGGAIAANASGARSFRYGPTRPWVEAVEAVLPTGAILRATRDTPIPEGWPHLSHAEPATKTAAGLFPASNLLDLLIGQEGTLAVITRAWLRHLPLPAGVLSFLAFFPELPSTLAFVEVARAQAQRARSPRAEPGPLNPRAIEYYDRHALDMVRARVPDIPDAAAHALFIEVEHEGEAPLERWYEALVEAGALADATIVAEEEAGRRRLAAVRHAVPAGVNERVVANGMPKVGTDFAVPDGALSAVMDLYEAEPMDKITFGHIGDNHLHMNLFPRSPAELAEAKRRYQQLARQCVALGGTVSAEHGIGKLKRHLLAEMLGPDVLAQFRALKLAVDPQWILGRGTLLEQAAP